MYVNESLNSNAGEPTLKEKIEKILSDILSDITHLNGGFYFVCHMYGLTHPLLSMGYGKAIHMKPAPHRGFDKP